MTNFFIGKKWCRYSDTPQSILLDAAPLTREGRKRLGRRPAGGWDGKGEEARGKGRGGGERSKDPGQPATRLVEHGDDEFRKKILKRSWKNEAIIESLKIPHRHGVQFTCNNIVGFPTETRDLAMKTIELNRQIESDSQNMNAFVPFHGTPLRKMVEEMGLVKPEEITKCLTDSPMLDMPQFSAKEITGLIKCFVLYVKFPKSRWKNIKRAEEDTPEGKKIFKELKEEFSEKYMPTISGANPKEIPVVADLEYGMELP